MAGTDFREKEGRVWNQTATLNGYVSAFSRLREPLKIPSRRNGLRHAFCTFPFRSAQQRKLDRRASGQFPRHDSRIYKGLATKAEAEKWFAVQPVRAANIIPLSANAKP